MSFLLETGAAAPALPQDEAKACTQNTTDTAEARAILREAKAAALRIQDEYHRRELLDEIGAAQAKSGDLEDASATVKQAGAYSSATFAAIGDYLAGLPDPSQLKAALVKLPKGDTRSISYALAEHQLNCGTVKNALNIAEQIPDKTSRSSLLTSIGTHQAQNGDYAASRKTLTEAKNADPEQFSAAYDIDSIIGEAQATRGDADAARATFAAMESADSRVISMLDLADQFEKKSNKDASLRWLNEAIDETPHTPEGDDFRYFEIPVQVHLGLAASAMEAVLSFEPELRMKGYLAIAVSCAEIKDISCMDRAMAEMRARAVSEGNKAGMTSDELGIVFANVTAALIESGQLEQASRVIAELRPEEDDGMGFARGRIDLQRAVIFADEGDFEAARITALKMQADSLGESDRGEAFRIIAVLKAKKDGIDSAADWARTLRDSDDRAHALLGAAQAFLKVGDVKLPYTAILVH